jgi:hypothetical protein
VYLRGICLGGRGTSSPFFIHAVGAGIVIVVTWEGPSRTAGTSWMRPVALCLPR